MYKEIKYLCLTAVIIISVGKKQKQKIHTNGKLNTFKEKKP